jgi:hypothetical protein
LKGFIHSRYVPGVKRIAVEAGVTDFWRKYVGLDGAVVGIDTFGESAPGGVLMEHFGFTVENLFLHYFFSRNSPIGSKSRIKPLMSITNQWLFVNEELYLT